MRYNAIIKVDDLVEITNENSPNYRDTGVVASIGQTVTLNLMPLLSGKSVKVSYKDIELVARKGTRKYAFMTQGSLPVTSKDNIKPVASPPPNQYSIGELADNYEKSLRTTDKTYLTKEDYLSLISLAIDLGDDEMRDEWVEQMNQKFPEKTC